MTPEDCASLPNDGPRVTPADVEAEIASEQYHVFPGTCLTMCCLVLHNGFTVTGEAACVYPENFRPEVGRKLARDKALDKIWMLLGFRLADQRHEMLRHADDAERSRYPE